MTVKALKKILNKFDDNAKVFCGSAEANWGWGTSFAKYVEPSILTDVDDGSVILTMNPHHMLEVEKRYNLKSVKN